MLTGNPHALPLAQSAVSEEQPFDAAQFAQYLLTLPNVREVKAAINAVLLEIECTARNEFDGVMEASGDELDSGTWFLIRVSDLPDPDARGGIVTFQRKIK